MEELNDYELLEYINSNNEEAHNLMFEKYKPLIVSIAKKYDSLGFKYGYEINDLIQEGMLGLSRAIDTFNINMNIKFYTLARVCIERKIMNLFKVGSRSKYKILNESIPIDNDEYNLENLIGDFDSNPLNIVLKDEEEKSILDALNNTLSDIEKKVLNLKQKGFTNDEIADILNKTRKQIDNTIQRIKNKYKKTRN